MKSSLTQSLGHILLRPQLLKSHPRKDRLVELLIEQQLGVFLIQNNLLEVLSDLKKTLVQSQVMINEIYFKHLKIVEEAFKKEDITYCRLKGSALMSRLKQNHRIMKDFDLLVPDYGDFLRAEKLLTDLGYQKTPQIRWSGADNRYDYFLLAPPNYLEIHTDLHNKLFWGASSAIQWKLENKNEAPTLSVEDQVFHSLVNWLYQDGGVGFYKIYDLFLLLKSAESFCWDRLRYLAQVQKLEHVVSIGLSVVDAIFHTKWSLNWPTPKDTSKYANKLISSDFFLAPKKQPLRYFYLKHWVRSSWPQAFYYDILWTMAYGGPLIKTIIRRAWYGFRRGHSKSKAGGLR
jgi:hypothetical protein